MKAGLKPAVRKTGPLKHRNSVELGGQPIPHMHSRQDRATSSAFLRIRWIRQIRGAFPCFPVFLFSCFPVFLFSCFPTFHLFRFFFLSVYSV